MAKPKLALLPAAQGSKLYSVLPSSGVGDFDFTRSGSATRINAQGLIETVGSGVSRLNYPMIDGVVKGCPHHILEPQRTQLIQYSEDTTEWDKNETPINTSNTTISPSGSLNADSVIVNSISEGFYDFSVGTVQSGTSYTFSIFIKYISGIETIRFGGSGSGFGGDNNNVFNIKNGTVVSVASGNTLSVNDYGNGWYRLIATKTASSTATAAWVLYGNENAEIQYSVWGVQVEQGSYPTSYIPNYGTSAGVTRSAETATGSGDAATFNDSEGVLMFEGSAIANDGTFRFLSLGANSSNGHQFIYSSVSNSIIYLIKSSGADRLSLQFTLPNALEFNKFGLKYKQNDFALWINGIEVSSSSVAILLPTSLSRLNFDSGSGASDFYGNTKQLQYFDTALTDSELETLTSWVSFEDMAISQQYSLY